jgi:hypothetical protein
MPRWECLTLEERMWRHISPEPNSGCWLWTAALTGGGYGGVGFAGKFCLAHRVMYEIVIGPIPAGLCLDHKCRVRCCVNPAHLEPVTVGENNRRGDSFWRKKTHCPQGHPYEGHNVMWKLGVQRSCRACHTACTHRRRAARRKLEAQLCA